MKHNWRIQIQNQLSRAINLQPSWEVVLQRRKPTEYFPMAGNELTRSVSRAPKPTNFTLSIISYLKLCKVICSSLKNVDKYNLISKMKYNVFNIQFKSLLGILLYVPNVYLSLAKETSKWCITRNVFNELTNWTLLSMKYRIMFSFHFKHYYIGILLATKPRSPKWGRVMRCTHVPVNTEIF